MYIYIYAYACIEFHLAFSRVFQASGAFTYIRTCSHPYTYHFSTHEHSHTHACPSCSRAQHVDTCACINTNIYIYTHIHIHKAPENSTCIHTSKWPISNA